MKSYFKAHIEFGVYIISKWENGKWVKCLDASNIKDASDFVDQLYHLGEVIFLEPDFKLEYNEEQ